MSKAVLCDKCKGVCSEQSATHIESKRFHYNNEIGWGIKTALNSTRWLNKGRVTHWMPLPEQPKEDTVKP